MKLLIKLALVVLLFTSNIFAEGDMGSGGRTCPNGQTPCLFYSEEPQYEDTTTKTEDSILIIVQEYLDSVFKYFEN